MQTTIDTVFTCWSANLLWLNHSKTKILRIGLPKQLSKVSHVALLMHSNVTITPSDSARNLNVIFDSSLTISDHFSSVSKSLCLFVTFVESEIHSIPLQLKLSLSFVPR